MASVYDTHKPASGEGGLYLKISDGETVKLRIISEPAIYESESERDGKVILTTRYAWLVWNQELNIPQILQQSATFFKSLAAIVQDEEWGDPKEYDIKVSRKGTELETKYNIVPSTNRDKLSTEAMKEVKEVDLIEKIKAGPYAQRVMWLSEYDQLASDPTPKAEVKAKPEKDIVHPVNTSDGDDSVVDLSDIPF